MFKSSQFNIPEMLISTFGEHHDYMPKYWIERWIATKTE